MSTITGSNSIVPSGERRRNPRHRTPSIIYARLGSGNGGIVVNLGIDGLKFQAAGKLTAEQDSTLNLRLRGDGLDAEFSGDIVWLGPTQKEAGICFKGLSASLQKDIAGWIARQTQDCEVAAVDQQPRLEPAPPVPVTPATGETSIPSSLSSALAASRAIPAPAPPSTNTDKDANESRLRFFLDSAAPVTGAMPPQKIVSPNDNYTIPLKNSDDRPRDRQPNSIASPKQPKVEQPLSMQPRLELLYSSLPIILPKPVTPSAQAKLAPTSEEPRKKEEPRKNGEIEQIPREDQVQASPASSREVATPEKWIPPLLLAAWRRGNRRQKLLFAGAAMACLWSLVLILTLTVAHITGSPLGSAGSESLQQTTAASGASGVDVGSHPEPGPPQAIPAAHATVHRRPDRGGISSIAEFFLGPSTDAETKIDIDEDQAKAQVWVSTGSGYYYCAGSPYYQTVQPGGFMTQGDALQSGYQPKLGEPCD